MTRKNDDSNFGISPYESYLPNSNQRRTVRYVRRDITARICKGYLPGVLGINWLKDEFKAKLLDISNSGCLIRSYKRLSINEKILVLLVFKTGKEFVIKSVVVREHHGRGYEYGVKFLDQTAEIGEYLLTTQKELKFK